jgi:hypothetical protein
VVLDVGTTGGWGGDVGTWAGRVGASENCF